MKIAVIAASGKVGKLVVNEAVARGMEVTAFVRKESDTRATHSVVKDLFDLTADDLRDFDVVVDAFGTWAPDTLDQHTTSLMHLADILSGTSTRLLVVGGAGSLYVDAAHSMTLVESPDFPAEYAPLARAQAAQLAALRKRSDVRWTYISPAADFQPEGARTGEYQIGGEELILNSAGASEISYADYAVALVDEIVNAAHVNQRIGVCSK